MTVSGCDGPLPVIPALHMTLYVPAASWTVTSTPVPGPMFSRSEATLPSGATISSSLTCEPLLMTLKVTAPAGAVLAPTSHEESVAVTSITPPPPLAPALSSFPHADSADSETRAALVAANTWTGRMRSPTRRVRAGVPIAGLPGPAGHVGERPTKAYLTWPYLTSLRQAGRAVVV